MNLTSVRYLPGSALVDEDQGTQDDAGQRDAHAHDDPRHGTLVDVVDAVGLN